MSHTEELAELMEVTVKEEGWSAVIEVLTERLNFAIVSQTTVVKNAAGVQITIKIPDQSESEMKPSNPQSSFDEDRQLHTPSEPAVSLYSKSDTHNE